MCLGLETTALILSDHLLCIPEGRLLCKASALSRSHMIWICLFWLLEVVKTETILVLYISYLIVQEKLNINSNKSHAILANMYIQ